MMDSIGSEVCCIAGYLAQACLSGDATAPLSRQSMSNDSSPHGFDFARAAALRLT